MKEMDKFLQACKILYLFKLTQGEMDNLNLNKSIREYEIYLKRYSHRETPRVYSSRQGRHGGLSGAAPAQLQ